LDDGRKIAVSRCDGKIAILSWLSQTVGKQRAAAVAVDEVVAIWRRLNG
jgi:hypothetical protein